jgi:hypothetical protein
MSKPEKVWGEVRERSVYPLKIGCGRGSLKIAI